MLQKSIRNKRAYVTKEHVTKEHVQQKSICNKRAYYATKEHVLQKKACVVERHKLEICYIIDIV